VRIGDLMTTNVPVVTPDDTVRMAAQAMAGAGVKALPVCDGDVLVGVLTDWDVTRAVASGAAPDEDRVNAFMTADVVHAAPDALVGHAWTLMAERRIHHLLICDSGRFVGMVHLDVEWSDLDGIGVPHATFGAAV
jgi:CBS domain-containing protein